MTAQNLTIFEFENEKVLRFDRKNPQAYKVFQVFELPSILEISNEQGELMLEPTFFLQNCLENVKKRNHTNMQTKQQRSSDYFTSLNHAERYRIPLAMRRFNGGFADEHTGLMSFIVMRGETVKNKVYNQRVSSINPELLQFNRIAEIIYPLSYQLKQPLKLHSLGRVIEVPQENFCVLRVDEKWLKHRKDE